MDEQTPLTYYNIGYSSINYINYANRITNAGDVSAVSLIRNECVVATTDTGTNIASTEAIYSLSSWNTATMLNRYNYIGTDFGSDNFSVGVKWGVNYRCEYSNTPLTVDNNGLYQYIYNDNSPYAFFDATAQKRNRIKSKLTIIIKSRAQELCTIPDNEWVAMQTLREMITEADYRKYIKDGFITIRGQSGKIYQIFRNKSHTKVYFKGELIEEICVRLKSNAPPTDSVIAFKTMIEVDEESFAVLGNRYNMKQAA
jgi:hypothetical protein